MKKRILLIVLLTIAKTISVGAQNKESVFDRYFAEAQSFSQLWPREKVYLQFDNTSYFQGDTIWFKAYVVDAASLQPSQISKPLYVELVDQLGNVQEKQIIKLTNGEGQGQISLANAFFTGYYEVRAYTKWMLAFSDDPQYFSRTLPVYRKRLSQEEPRSIASYRMDESMKQRPKDKEKGLTVRFFPEGGNLVKGLTSVVAFEAFSTDSGHVNLSGQLLSADGTPISPIAAVHDGMGSFMYQPGEKPGKVVLEYKGKKHSFKLPDALSQGYVVRVNNRGDAFDISVQRSQTLNDEPLALFVFSQGVPCTYVPVDFGKTSEMHLKVMTAELPAGIARISLVNAQGQPLLDRFAFVYPRQMPQLSGQVEGRVFQPYQAVNTKIRLADAQGKPLSNATLAVSVRDGIESDYIENDDNILTNLLLTSDLRGHISRPGFYFATQSASRRKMLDNLLLVRGWRRYDIEAEFGKKKFEPRYVPEDRLTLYGQVKSMYTSKLQAGLGVTILAQNDTVNIAGSTVTDSLGYFNVPIDEFYGILESLIQTKKDGKQFNRNTRVSLFRTFEPPLRKLEFSELNPRWDNLADTLSLHQEIDSLLSVGTEYYDALQLDEVVVKGKKRSNLLKRTEAFERDILAYYNIRQIIERMRDEGKFVPDDFGNLLYTINPKKINREGTAYGVDTIKYSVNGKLIPQDFINRGTMDMMETAMLYHDLMGRSSYAYSGNSYRVTEKDADDFFTNTHTTEQDTTNYAMFNQTFVRCELSMHPRWNPNKNYRPTHGIRQTEIQGYSLPVEFYAPLYSSGVPEFVEDRRRTLYWNPSLKTDADGVVVIDCFNSFNPTYVNISAEALVDGLPVSAVFSSFAE
ncbi:MAG: hypothetical protein IJ196_02410 [Prevotella sp.]|nr:hypothetical protein [Prevotella sp.]